jgi:hypothetical protein
VGVLGGLVPALSPPLPLGPACARGQADEVAVLSWGSWGSWGSTAVAGGAAAAVAAQGQVLLGPASAGALAAAAGAQGAPAQATGSVPGQLRQLAPARAAGGDRLPMSRKSLSLLVLLSGSMASGAVAATSSAASLPSSRPASTAATAAAASAVQVPEGRPSRLLRRGSEEVRRRLACLTRPPGTAPALQGPSPPSGTPVALWAAATASWRALVEGRWALESQGSRSSVTCSGSSGSSSSRWGQALAGSTLCCLKSTL